MYSKRKAKKRNITRFKYLWICPESGARGGIWKRRRLCTQRVEEESNWIFSNYSFFAELDAHYEQMWAEYYGGLL